MPEKKSTLMLFAAMLVVIVVLTTYSLTGRAMFPGGPAGSYFVTVQKSDDPNTKMQMLVTFTEGGQILTTDTVAFGATPFRCPNQAPLTSGSVADKFQSPGHGDWERRGRSIFFQVLTFRFDDKGNPIGMLRVNGIGTGRADGTASGKATVSFLNDMPTDASDNAATLECSVDATFTAVPIRAGVPKGEEKQ